MARSSRALLLGASVLSLALARQIPGSVMLLDPQQNLHHPAAGSSTPSVRLSELGAMVAGVLGVPAATAPSNALPTSDILRRPQANVLVSIEGFPTNLDGARFVSCWSSAHPRRAPILVQRAARASLRRPSPAACLPRRRDSPPYAPPPPPPPLSPSLSLSLSLSLLLLLLPDTVLRVPTAPFPTPPPRVCGGAVRAREAA